MDLNKQELQSEKKSQKPEGFLGVRHLQYFLMFSCIILAYGMRTIFNVAIVEIINEDGKSSEEITYPIYPEWTSKKNMLLSSFFWGYICLQVGAGQLAKLYGAKRFLFCVVFISAVFSVLIPIAGSTLGYGGVIACRIAQGLSQGFMFPSIHTLLSKWAPISERAKWGGIVYAGQPVGNVLAMPIAGAISGSKVGWPAVFYFYGVFGFLWCVVWIFFGSNSPGDHKSISMEERKAIESGIDGEDSKKKVPTPWKAILTSPPFLSILVTHCGQNWGFWTLLTEIPSFMAEILDFNIESNSFLSALPYFVMFILNITMSPLADWLVKKKYVSLIVSRKIFNSIGLFVPAVALISLCFVGHDKTLTVFILVIAVGFNAAQYCGFNINHMDLSPIHAGVLMGITNASSTVFSILAPLTVDAVKTVTGYEEKEKKLWNIVFLISASLYSISGIVFLVFGSGEVQPWNMLASDDTKERKESKAKKSLEANT